MKNISDLDGEPLDSEPELVRVIAALHPFRSDRIETKVRHGTTLQEIAALMASKPECRFPASGFHARVDGREMPLGMWPYIKPKPNGIVTLDPRTGDPVTAVIGAIGAAFGSIGGLVGGGFLGSLLTAGVVGGASMLINRLFAPRTKSQGVEEINTSYSIMGSRNEAAQYGTIPSILGRHRVTPKLGGLPTTEAVGEDQYLRMLFVWGYGPLSITDIKIGETPITNFDDVQIETREGLVGDAAVTLYTKSFIEEALTIDLVTGMDFQVRTTATNVSLISVDIVLPNGLMWVHYTGDKNPMGFGWQARYRVAGSGGAWTTFKNEFITRETQKIIRLNAQVAVAAGQYEVGVCRTMTALPTPGADGSYVVEAAQWTALRGARAGAPITFSKKLAITAIRIRATSQLNGIIDNLNGICTSKVTAWNGSSWVANTISRNPANLYRHVLQGAANNRPLTDAEIDLVGLQNWWAYCNTSGWTFDMPRDQKTSVYDVLLDICAAGRAVPVFKDSRWSVIWDEAATPIVQMFTPANSRNFKAQKEIREKIHALRMRFSNEVKGWVEDERLVYNDGYTAANATKFEGLDLRGVTHTNNAWKHGRYFLADIELRPEIYTLDIDWENIKCTRGDRIRVQHDVPLIGVGSGRVISTDVGGQTVTVDEALILASASAYQFRFKLVDDTWLVRLVVPGTAGELRTFPLVGTGALPDPDIQFSFGELDSDSAIYRLMKIEPQRDLGATITFVDDAPGIYLADTGAIPEYDSGVTEPVDPFTLPPLDLRLSSGAYLDGTNYVAWVKMSWQQSRYGKTIRSDVEYLDPDNGRWTPAGSAAAGISEFEVRGLDAGAYTFRVRNVFDDGTFSTWLTSPVFSLSELLGAPPDVTQFRIDTLGAQSLLSWTGVGVVGVTYEVRHAPSTVASPDWNTSVPLVVGISGEFVQVPTMVGTYFIKAVLPSGVKSVTAASIYSNVLEIFGLNIVEFVDDGPTWPGTKENVVERSGEIQLGFRDQMANWDTLTSIQVLMLGDGEADSIGLNYEGTYYVAETADLGAVYTVRMSYEIVARGRDSYNTISLWTSLSAVSQLSTVDPAEWSVILEYRSSVLAPAADVWSDWQPFVVGDVSARAFQYRLKLIGLRSTDITSLYATTTPVVTSLFITIDMPDRTDNERDLLVTVAGRAITYPHGPFRAIPTVVYAIQDGLSGDRWVYTALPTITGFTVEIRDSGGALVQRTIDYVAKGYGGELV